MGGILFQPGVGRVVSGQLLIGPSMQPNLTSYSLAFTTPHIDMGPAYLREPSRDHKVDDLEFFSPGRGDSGQVEFYRLKQIEFYQSGLTELSLEKVIELYHSGQTELRSLEMGSRRGEGKWSLPGLEGKFELSCDFQNKRVVVARPGKDSSIVLNHEISSNKPGNSQLSDDMYRLLYQSRFFDFPTVYRLVGLTKRAAQYVAITTEHYVDDCYGRYATYVGIPGAMYSMGKSRETYHSSNHEFQTPVGPVVLDPTVPLRNNPVVEELLTGGTLVFSSEEEMEIHVLKRLGFI